MVDVLYIKGDKSPNDDLEMMYSLRSLEDNVIDCDRVFITGKCPDFIDKSKVVYTPAKDVGAPMMNHWWKVFETILRTDISDDFALMYDDIFFTKTVALKDYPFYKRGVLGEMETGGAIYKVNLMNTRGWLEKHGFYYYDFELHTPCIYNKKKFKMLDNIFLPIVKTQYPISCRSVYGNLYCKDHPYREDVKLRTKYDKVPMDTDCFSVSDEAFKYNTLEYLKGRYNWKGYYEL